MMHRSWGGKYGHRPYGWSPWMGLGIVFLLVLFLSKGLFWPLLLIFLGFAMFSGRWGHGGHRRWMHEYEQQKQKGKNDDYYDEYIEKPKRKNVDEDGETIYYA